MQSNLVFRRTYLEIGDVLKEEGIPVRNLSLNLVVHGVDVSLINAHATLGQ